VSSDENPRPNEYFTESWQGIDSFPLKEDFLCKYCVFDSISYDDAIILFVFLYWIIPLVKDGIRWKNPSGW
jgi:hypothetical protein